MAVDRRTMLLGITATTVGILTGCTEDSGPDAGPSASAPSPAPQPSAPTTSPPTSGAAGPARPKVTRTVAENLTVPWGIAFLASGDALVSERDTARILRVRPGGGVVEMTTVPGVDTASAGEGGLLGLALSPDESALFVYLTATDDNRIVRMSLNGDRLGDPEPILTGIPRSDHHNGGRLLLTDGLLYATTGDAGDGARAQDKDSLGGKILRLGLDGSAAPGNPFGNEVWSYGHRNVEGIALDADGRLWASEFGNQETDEMNLIVKGGNYGWPQTEGKTDEPGLKSPKATWPTDDCSPSGIAIARSTAYLGALQGECLWAVPLDGTDAGKPVRFLGGDHGRIRTVVAAPGGGLWVTTSNTDGRATPRDGDDRILQVSLSA